MATGSGGAGDAEAPKHFSRGCCVTVKHAISWRPHLETVPFKESGCLPNRRVVFIKTHKTGSTTTAAIFERFGFRRNLSFAMDSKLHFFPPTKLFNHSMAFEVPHRNRQDFDLLVNHARFDKKEMAIAVPNAKYISIIRNPVNQLESAFGYFEMGKQLQIKTKQPFITFIMNPMKYLREKSYMGWLLRNGQLFALGLDTKYHENLTVVSNKINQLSTEIHLIMLNEYYDESMILLKKLMCWDFEDVLYTKLGIRSKSHRNSINKTVEAKIKEWNAADVMLYDHFNRSFWGKIRAYGPTFSDDLAHLRAMLKNVSDMCIDPGKKYLKDKRVEEFMLKPNSSKYCQDLIRNDVQYTKLIRNGMVKRARALI
ncbi:galactosylceramide sulfotransferase-like [Lytechinus pictus]|uniref:galactosylceramide sulfotransferase-like n=1 Tax=Lytechinus pictus TaxID=7653 RepID=UPI0030BA1D88